MEYWFCLVCNATQGMKFSIKPPHCPLHGEMHQTTKDGFTRLLHDKLSKGYG